MFCMKTFLMRNPAMDLFIIGINLMSDINLIISLI